MTIAILFALAAALAVSLWFSHTLSYTWKRGSESVTKDVTASADGEKNLDLVIPTGTVDQLVNIAIKKANIKSVFIVSDQNVTLETNSGSAPADTLALVANNPVVYLPATPGMVNPFNTADVTAIYVTNASGATATITFRCLEDTTP